MLLVFSTQLINGGAQGAGLGLMHARACVCVCVCVCVRVHINIVWIVITGAKRLGRG